MRNLRAAAIAAFLLMVSRSFTDAMLLEPKGEKKGLDTDTGYDFGFKFDITVFGEKISTDKKHYVSRKTGRITLGNGVFDGSDFDLLMTRGFHLLQPSEVPGSAIGKAPDLYYKTMNEDQLKMMQEIIHANFWAATDFAPLSDGHLFTWEFLRHKSDPDWVNTFQVALVYGVTSTYVLFNYVQMDLVYSGVSVLAGFSRGGGSYDSAFLPFSGEHLKRLPAVSGVGNRTLGHFVYQIDTWPPKRGGCLSEDPPYPADRILSSTVQQDSVLGGGLAILSARCPSPGASGVCSVRMGDNVIGESPTLSCTRCRDVFLACQVPPSYRVGRGTLSLNVTTQQDVYSTGITFVRPDDAQKIRLTGDLELWMSISAAQRKITYDPAQLKGNLTLYIMGYSEFGLSQIKSTLTKALFSTAANPSGNMDLSSYSCSQAECDTHHVGYLEIVDSDSPPNSIRSRIIPLGWFVSKYYQTNPNWARDKCEALSSTDTETKKVRERLATLTCPPTLDLAYADVSRYLPLSYCPELPGGCGSATPKQLCFLSKSENNPDTHGVLSAVCCYDEAKRTLLLQEAAISGSAVWSQHGSRTLRAHPDGLPFTANLLPGQVSFMSNWYWDTLPFLYCCRWTSQGECPYYFMNERPSPRLSSYAAGRGSSSVGDPHMTSFSGRPFLFNGYGEYWLLESEDFHVQGRYLKLPGIESATFLVALAFKVDRGPAFEVNVLLGTIKFRVLRRVEDSITEVPLRSDFSYIEGGVTIKLINNNDMAIQLSRNSRSVGIDLYAADVGFMNSFVSLSDKMKEQTRGLLGRWTNDSANEFVDIDNRVAKFDQNATTFHKEFCVKNLLKDGHVNSSLFNYNGVRAGEFKRINTLDRVSFEAKAVYSADKKEHGQEKEICQSDKNCVFDIRVTENVDIAKLTAGFDKLFGQRQAALNTTVAYCDKPSIRGISLAADASLLEGASLTITCAAPLSSSRASETIKCTKQGDGSLKWDPDPTASNFQCNFPNVNPPAASGANVGLIVGITVPLVVVLAIVLVVGIFLLRRRSNPSGGRSGGRSNPPRSQQQQQQQQQQRQLQTSQMTIVSSAESERGYDNSGHSANPRVIPSVVAANSGGDGGIGGDPKMDQTTRSQQQERSTMQSDFVPRMLNTEYATPGAPTRVQVGKSEVV